jgi:hypothetical protein
VSERRAGLPERIRHDVQTRVARPLNRRAFLAAGVASAIGVATVGGRPAGAVAGVTVFRLRADWGYPVGPKGKTRCACKACFRRADSAYFTTKGAAIAGRIHPCCLCQPYRTTVAGIPSGALFAGQVSADVRDPRVAAVFAAAPMAEPFGEPPTSGSADGDPLDPSPRSPSADGFARTGSTLRLPMIGAAMVAAGGALMAFRSRRTTAGPPASVDNPCLDNPYLDNP